jgi:hypothetical protein
MSDCKAIKINAELETMGVSYGRVFGVGASEEEVSGSRILDSPEPSIRESNRPKHERELSIIGGGRPRQRRQCR